MIRSEKKFRELELALRNENTVPVTRAIELLRDEEAFEGAIGLLIACFDRTDNQSIRRLISGFMNDLKDLSSRGEVINEIKKEWKPETLTMLVSSCWQSGLDYSEYCTELAQVFISGNYLTALECFTVIEESAHLINPADKNEMLRILYEGNTSQADEKSTLTLELIRLMKE